MKELDINSNKTPPLTEQETQSLVEYFKILIKIDERVHSGKENTKETCEAGLNNSVILKK